MWVVIIRIHVPALGTAVVLFEQCLESWSGTAAHHSIANPSRNLDGGSKQTHG